MKNKSLETFSSFLPPRREGLGGLSWNDRYGTVVLVKINQCELLCGECFCVYVLKYDCEYFFRGFVIDNRLSMFVFIEFYLLYNLFCLSLCVRN
jgi:hypothetical protein